MAEVAGDFAAQAAREVAIGFLRVLGLERE
jgi:hypothetical protein